MVKPKVGAELVVWGMSPFGESRQELPDVLDEVSSLGYEGIEYLMQPFTGYSDPKGLLDTRGLAFAGLHTGHNTLDEKPSDIDLEFLRKMDGRYLIVSSGMNLMMENTVKNYRRSAKFMEKIGKKASKEGVKFCFHNHQHDMVDIDHNVSGMDIILEETTPEHVFLCVDTFWAKVAGVSPAEFIKENLDRVPYLHLKDGRIELGQLSTTEQMLQKQKVSQILKRMGITGQLDTTEQMLQKHKFLELGKGIVDFPAILEVAKSADIEWVVVEQDETDLSPKESMAISRNYLKERFEP